MPIIKAVIQLPEAVNSNGEVFYIRGAKNPRGEGSVTGIMELPESTIVSVSTTTNEGGSNGTQTHRKTPAALLINLSNGQSVKYVNTPYHIYETP